MYKSMIEKHDLYFKQYNRSCHLGKGIIYHAIYRIIAVNCQQIFKLFFPTLSFLFHCCPNGSPRSLNIFPIIHHPIILSTLHPSSHMQVILQFEFRISLELLCPRSSGFFREIFLKDFYYCFFLKTIHELAFSESFQGASENIQEAITFKTAFPIS